MRHQNASLIIVAMLVAAPAAAAEKTFKEHVDAGLDAYEARRYTDAIEHFETAFALKPEPNLVYNIARSYERALMRTQAIAAYQRFVSLEGTTAVLRKRALAQMEAIRSEQAILARSKKPREANEPKPPPEAVVVTAAPPPPSALGPLPWVVVGVGVASIVAGGVFGVQASSHQSDFEAATNIDAKRTARDRARRDAMYADVLIGGGLVLGAVGVALHFFGPDEEPVQVMPSVGPNRAGLLLGGSF